MLMATKYTDNISFPRLSNAYHVAFFSDVKAGIDKYQPVNLGIADDVYERFDGALDLEQDIVNRARASAFTKQLADLDTKRDNYFRRIYYKLKNAENDSDNPKMTPELIQKIQVHLLSQYGLGLCSEATQKETAKLRGFIKDVRTFLFDSLTDLEINKDLTTLEAANNSYEEAYMNRVSEQASLPASTTLREATESAYLTITYILATNANNPSTDNDDRLKAQYCQRMIDEINVVIKDFKQKAYTSAAQNDNDNFEDAIEDVTEVVNS